MSLSNSRLNKLKKALQSGDTQLVIQYLSETTDKSDLDIIKEQKLMLVSDDNESLAEAYLNCTQRLLDKQDAQKTEVNYIAFLNEYKEATNNLRKQIRELLSPFLEYSLKEFVVLTQVFLENYTAQLAQQFYQQYDKQKKFVQLDHIAEQSEWSHHTLKGQVNDILFALTNLINLFSGWRIKYSNKGLDNFKGEYEVESLIEAVELSANINSYSYALDRVSYGEWKVENYYKQKNRITFEFSIIDARLEKARLIGLKRILSDYMRGRKKKRWLRDLLEEFVLESLDTAWDEYQSQSNLLITNSSEYEKAKERILKHLDELNVEDELLIGLNAQDISVISPYLIACTLITYVTTAEFLKLKSHVHFFRFTCPKVPEDVINEFFKSFRINNSFVQGTIDNFTVELPLRHHIDLFSTPFIRDEHNNIYSVGYLSQGNWPTWVRAYLMKGGATANQIGKSWEDYIASIMREDHWDKVVQSLKLKKNGNILTDVDILAKRKNTLLIIQMKVFYGNGINQYEQWKYRKKLIHAVEQAKVATEAIRTDITLLKAHFNANDFEAIDHIQPLVMTNSHIFNGWKYDGVSIISTGGLMQVINGATVKFETESGVVLDEKQYAKSKNLSEEEFMEFIERPLDWRIGNAEYRTKYHTEKFDKHTLKFPILESCQ